MPVTNKVYGTMALVWLFTACVPVEDRGMYDYDAEEDTSIEPAGSECEEIWQTEVKPYLDEKCTMCHGESLVGDAPMSLATYAESIAPSPYGAGPLYDRIFVRADEQTMPLSGGNTPEELAVLENWAAVCADELAEPAEEEGGESTEEEGGESSEEGGEVAEEEGGESGEGGGTEEGGESSEEGGVEEGGESSEEEGGESSEEGGAEEGGAEEGGELVVGISYSVDVEPFLQEECVPCHFGGYATPFDMTYAMENTTSMIDHIDNGTMPPGGGADPALADILEQWAEGGYLP